MTRSLPIAIALLACLCATSVRAADPQAQSNPGLPNVSKTMLTSPSSTPSSPPSYPNNEILTGSPGAMLVSVQVKDNVITHVLSNYNYAIKGTPLSQNTFEPEYYWKFWVYDQNRNLVKHGNLHVQITALDEKDVAVTYYLTDTPNMQGITVDFKKLGAVFKGPMSFTLTVFGPTPEGG